MQEGPYDLNHDYDLPMNNLETLQQRLGKEPCDGWEFAGRVDGRLTEFLTYVTEGRGTLEITPVDADECNVKLDNGDERISELTVSWDNPRLIAQLMHAYQMGRGD